MRARLFTDADNTLWDTNAVYAAAQLSLARNVAKVSPQPVSIDVGDEAVLRLVRALDQRLAVDHELGLRYPPLLLAKALHVSFGGDGDDDALAEALNLHRAVLSEKPPLRAGVREGIATVTSATGRLVIVTESHEARCIELLDHYKLAEFVERVVCGTKSPSMYGALREFTSTDVMVGDQLDRDIAFAQAADFVGVLFSGGFAPFWTSNLDVRPDYSISDFQEMVPIIARLISDGSSQAPSTSWHATPARGLAESL